MKENCIILALDNNPEEPDYHKMIFLLIHSVRMFDQDIDIHILIGSDRVPTHTINLLKNLKKIFIYHNEFQSIQRIRYFLRNYCIKYFSYDQNLLKKYNQLIYIDIDVILIDKPSWPILNPNEIIVEKVPDEIIKIENNILRKNINNSKPVYYNWFTIVTDSNRFIWNIDYVSVTVLKDSDIEISRRINKSSLKIIDQTIGAYYPKHKLHKGTFLFHYDGFIDSGYFYKLKDFSPKLYSKLNKILKIYNIKDNSVENYWENIKELE